MMKSFRPQRGFTLIELLIVIAILGILAAIAVPKFAEYRDKQKNKAKRDTLIVASDENQGQWPPIGDTLVPTDIESLLRKNYYVVFDGSGSMKERGCSGDSDKATVAIAAMQDFFASIPAEYNVGLLAFDNSGFSERVPLGINNRTQLQTALQAIRPEGGTPLSEAVKVGYEALTTQASHQLGYGEYHLVFVTDGEASLGYNPSGEIERVLRQTPIVIHTIGFCIGEGHSLNQPGRTFYSSVDNAQDLTRELKAVLAESESFDLTEFQN